ncbi:hypothetical protein D3C83_296470 [compost metagenome]
MSGVWGQLLGLYGPTQRGSTLPPTQTVAAIEYTLKQYAALTAQWQALEKSR